MKLQNILVFAIKCIYIFAASFALTELVAWHFLEAKIGNNAAVHIFALAATLYALRVISMILQKAVDINIAWKPYVGILWTLGFMYGQLFVLGIEGVLTSHKQAFLVGAWIMVNAVSLSVSIYLCEHSITPDSCGSGTCH